MNKKLKKKEVTRDFAGNLGLKFPHSRSPW